MAGLGYGIGSFLEGLSKGAAVGNQMRRQDAEDALNERRMKLAESADARAATAADLSNKVTQTNLDNTQADRAANAPILAAQRKSTLGALNDADELRNIGQQAQTDGQSEYEAEKAKSIAVGKDASGKPIYTIDGQDTTTDADKAKDIFEQRHGTAQDYVRNKMLPAYKAKLVAMGQPEKADAFQKWSDNQDVQRGQETVGRATQAAAMGDWDSASKYTNQVFDNESYFNKDAHEASVAPIKGDDGKTAGLRLTYKDKATGKELTQDFKDKDEFIHAIGTYISPIATFEGNTATYQAKLAAAAETKKAQDDAAKQITIKNAESANKIEEERAKSALTIAQERAKTLNVTPEKYLTEFAAVHKNLSENNQDFQKAKPDVQAKMAADVVDAGIRRGQSFVAPQSPVGQPEQAAPPAAPQPAQAAPQQPSGAQAAPAQAPAGRSIMPAGAATPTVAVPMRRQIPFFAQ